MDDQRDYEEERAQEAALSEEQEAELEASELAGLEPGPEQEEVISVDSSSDEWIPLEEFEQLTDSNTRMLWQDGVINEPFIIQMAEMASLATFTQQKLQQLYMLHEGGLAADNGVVAVDVLPDEQIVLSLALNVVGFFSKRSQEPAERLMRRLHAKVREFVSDEETKELVSSILQKHEEEAMASLFGLTPEQFREAKAKFEAGEEYAPEAPGGSNLN